MWEKFRYEVRVERPGAFRSEIVKLTLPLIPRDMTRNVHHTQPVGPEDLEVKLR